MKHLLLESGYFVEEWKKIRELRSPLLVSAARMAEAAFWLLGGEEYAQALVVLDNAIEVALKGELARIHPVLIADPKTLLTFPKLKSLVKKAYFQHPEGKNLQIGEFDILSSEIDKTIDFGTAFKHVAELFPEIGPKWGRRLLPSNNGSSSLHSFRNQIVHSGGNEEMQGEYAECIAGVALPFLEEFFQLITRHEAKPVQISRLLKEWLYRDVEIAKKVFDDLRSDHLPAATYAMAPLAHHILWCNAHWRNPYDDLDTVDCNDGWYEYAERQKNPKEWGDAPVVEVDCPICGSSSDGGALIPARVLLDETSLDSGALIPKAFLCIICGFEILPSQTHLAKHFVPSIPAATAAALLEDLGIE